MCTRMDSEKTEELFLVLKVENLQLQLLNLFPWHVSFHLVFILKVENARRVALALQESEICVSGSAEFSKSF